MMMFRLHSRNALSELVVHNDAVFRIISARSATMAFGD